MIIQPGVVKESMIGRLSCELFLFICTGNTCRSPLAEGFFRKMLADRLRCAEDELADHGYMVLRRNVGGSRCAGGSRVGGSGARLRRRPAGPQSQPVTDRLLNSPTASSR